MYIKSLTEKCQEITPCKVADAVNRISLSHVIIALVSGCLKPKSSFTEKNCNISYELSKLNVTMNNLNQPDLTTVVQITAFMIFTQSMDENTTYECDKHDQTSQPGQGSHDLDPHCLHYYVS